MIHLLFACALLLPAPVQDEKKTDEADVLDPKVVAAAVEDLEQAFKKGEAADRIAAIERQSKVVDGGVVDWIAKGLKDKDEKVKAAAIEALRWMRHPHSLDALHTAYKKQKDLAKNAELYAALIRAFAQHGDVRSIDLLRDNPLNKVDVRVARARIYGLGMIRSADSVEALMGLMHVAGRWKIQSVMKDFRVSLMVLTGADQGLSQDAWTSWWNNNKKTFEVPREQPELPRQVQNGWNRYWGLEVERERPEKRRERGGGDDL